MVNTFNKSYINLNVNHLNNGDIDKNVVVDVNVVKKNMDVDLLDVYNIASRQPAYDLLFLDVHALYVDNMSKQYISLVL